MSRIRVIIADDSPSFREELRTLLELEGVEVVGEAANGWEAIEQAASLKPDLVLMDQNMPALSGVDATRKIKDQQPDMRVVFIGAEDVWEEEALAAGAEVYFIKDRDLVAMLEYLKAESPPLPAATETVEAEQPLTRWRALLQRRGELVAAGPQALAASLLIWLTGGAAIAAGRHVGLLSSPGDSWLVVAVGMLGPVLGLTHVVLELTDTESRPRRKWKSRLDPILRRWRRVESRPDYDRLAKATWLVLLGSLLLALLFSPALRSAIRQVTLGQVIASVSLGFGLLFFLYAARYYAIIGLILLHSGGNGNGNGKGNGNGLEKNGVNGNGSNGRASNGHGLKKNGITGHNGEAEHAHVHLDHAATGSLSWARRLVSRLLNGLLHLGHHNGSNGLKNGLGNGNGDHSNGETGNGFGLPLERQPFVSIQLPMYNEHSVVDRLVEACTHLDYDNYEVIVADDSSDQTVRRLERWAKHPKVKVSHRINRSGFKGAALKHAMEIMDPRTEFVAIFDADFVPPPHIIWQFLAYFFGATGNGNGNGNGHGHDNGNGHGLKANGYGNGNGHSSGSGNGSGAPYEGRASRYVDDKVAAVQGYQWHMLNADENWLTKGVRAEYSGSYVMERSGQELLGTMKMISGTVYMIRADVLRQLGWGTSITEDWELTIKLYLYGYKVLYTPFIQAPSECVSTFGRLVRQRMRWAEGHTFNVKKYFPLVMASPRLSLGEKLEFLYYAPYYLQSLFFMVGTAAWFISELIFRQGVPYWTSLLGWSLVLTNMGALSLMNLAGLFMERGVKREWTGVLSAVVLGMLLVPFQGYAAFKGLIEPKEGGWFRTPKTGAITEVIDRLDLGGKLKWLLPRRKKEAPKKAPSRFSRLPGFGRLIRRPGRLVNGLIGGMAAMAMVLALFSPLVPVVEAAPDVFNLHTDFTMDGTTGTAGSVTYTSNQDYTWASVLNYPTGGDPGSIAQGDYTVTVYFSLSSSNGNHYTELEFVLTYGATTIGTVSGERFYGGASSPRTITLATNYGPLTLDENPAQPLRLRIYQTAKAGPQQMTVYMDDPGVTGQTVLNTPAITVPELGILLLPFAVILPPAMLEILRRRRLAVVKVSIDD